MSENNSTPTSPTWSTNTKLVVALTFVAITAFLLVRFRAFVGPLVMAFILAYLLHPIAIFISTKTHIAWRGAVSILYLFVLLLLIGLLTLSGVGLVQQIQSLISLLNRSLTALPDLLQQYSKTVYHFGPFQIDLTHLNLDLNTLNQQLISSIQPILGRTGDLVGTIAGGAAQILGLSAFILLISYFVVLESGGLRGQILNVDIPGYTEDLHRLGHELGRIWNAFLRGQMILFVLTVIVYFVVMSILGVRYAIGIALLAGFARFLPYVGPAITWVVLALVSYFQVFKLFGMSPLSYAILTVALGLLVDQIFDNLITPRVMSQALRVHPAAVLVAAIIAANLLGFLGVIVAAPMLATLKLFGQYVLRKMLDLDPWPESEEPLRPVPRGLGLWLRIRRWWRKRRSADKSTAESE